MAKITGTDRSDWLHGSGDNDNRYAGAGNDWLYGDAGDAGDDLMYGGGNDWLYGGTGDATLVGQGGNDKQTAEPATTPSCSAPVTAPTPSRTSSTGRTGST